MANHTCTNPHIQKYFQDKFKNPKLQTTKFITATSVTLRQIFVNSMTTNL